MRASQPLARLWRQLLHCRYWDANCLGTQVVMSHQAHLHLLPSWHCWGVSPVQVSEKGTGTCDADADADAAGVLLGSTLGAGVLLGSGDFEGLGVGVGVGECDGERDGDGVGVTDGDGE